MCKENNTNFEVTLAGVERLLKRTDELIMGLGSNGDNYSLADYIDKPYIPGTKGKILYLFININSDDTELVRKDLEIILNMLLEHNGMIWSFDCSVVMTSFGFPRCSYEEGLYSRNLVIDELSKQFRSTIRIVYGVTEGAFDFLGCLKQRNYLPIFPLYGQKLQHLFSLDAGAIEEF